MEYTELTTDEQKSILAQRLKQYEVEHFNHSVNRELLERSSATGEEVEKAVKLATLAMEQLDDAHTKTTAKLKALRNKDKG